MKHLSLADIPESELVDRLMNDRFYRDSLISIHGIPPNVMHRLAVPMRGLPNDPRGDIDILLVPSGSPENSIAIEVKRIKVARTAFHKQGQPNRINELNKGVRQSNLLAKIGFSQVYYLVLVPVDSRDHNNQESTTLDGLTQTLNTLITQQISSKIETLDSRVGLMRFDLIQPMDYAPLGTGASHGHLIRLAAPSLQPKAVTEWVQRITDTTTIQAMPE